MYKNVISVPEKTKPRLLQNYLLFKMYSLLSLLVPLLLIAFQVFLWLGRALIAPLKDIPGPFWARFTSLWYFNRVSKGNFQYENIRLHQMYGPVVRVAPNQYSISDPSAIKTIYGSGTRFSKSAWYDVWRQPGQWNVFSQRDIKKHGSLNNSFLVGHSTSSETSSTESH